MSNRLRAWKELSRLFGLGYLRYKKNIMNFFRANILRPIQEEGWFDFLGQEHSSQEILDKFGYTDLGFLETILDALVEDKILYKSSEGNYGLSSIDESIFTANPDLSERHKAMYIEYTKSLPERLRGVVFDVTKGRTLYDWDSASNALVYDVVRKAAFAFIGGVKPGRFLHLMCMNGYQTAAIWWEMFQQGFFSDSMDSEIVGVHPDDNLIEIALYEYELRLLEVLKKDKRVRTGNIEELRAKLSEKEDCFPQFHSSSLSKLKNFRANVFDYVFISQGLQWVNAPVALREAMRVLKPGGTFFGDFPVMDSERKWISITNRIVADAYGFLTKDDFIRFMKEAGAKNIRLATPIPLFKATK